MPRTRKTPAPAPARPELHPSTDVVIDPGKRVRTLVASGLNLAKAPDTTASKFGSSAAWQDRAWGFYDQVGELRFGANWLGNAMSRVKLKVIDAKGDEVTGGKAAEFLKSFFGGEEGQSQALRSIGIQLTIPGESWIVGRGAAEDSRDPLGVDQWLVVSETEISRQGKQWKVDRGDGRPFLLDVVDDQGEAGNDVVTRIWRSHPRRYAEADSPVRAMLGVLAELLQLTKKVAASIDSRLAGAGILTLPTEMEFSAPPSKTQDTPNGGQPDGQATPAFADAFADAIMTPIDDPADATALVPFIIQAPGAVLGNIQYIRFDTALSAEDRELRMEALRRLGLGMDLPVEVLMGQGDSNHWSAWQVDESAIKIHIEPMCELICAALTSEIFHPYLAGGNNLSDEEAGWSLVADTSDLRLRPNRPAEAQALNADGLVSDETVRRENGFEEGDKPDPAEFEQILLRRIATGAGNASPEMMLAAMQKLGITLDVPSPEPAAAPVGRALEPVPDVTQDTGPPEQLAASGARQGQFLAREVVALNVAAQLVCERAIERARNKYGRRNGSALRPLSIDQVNAGLAGGLDNVAPIAASFGYDPQNLTAVLGAYCQQTLTAGEEHDQRTLYGLMERFVRREVASRG